MKNLNIVAYERKRKDLLEYSLFRSNAEKHFDMSTDHIKLSHKLAAILHDIRAPAPAGSDSNKAKQGSLTLGHWREYRQSGPQSLQ